MDVVRIFPDMSVCSLYITCLYLCVMYRFFYLCFDFARLHASQLCVRVFVGSFATSSMPIPLCAVRNMYWSQMCPDLSCHLASIAWSSVPMK